MHTSDIVFAAVSPLPCGQLGLEMHTIASATHAIVAGGVRVAWAMPQ